MAKKTYYIAIVSRDLSDTVVQRSAFTSTNKQRAVSAAITARNEWQAKGNGPYKIFAGELSTEVVDIPVVNYDEVKIS